MLGANLGLLLYGEVSVIDDIINYNNLIILATCKEHIRSKNVNIRTHYKPWMCNEVRFSYEKGTVASNVSKEPY